MRRIIKIILPFAIGFAILWWMYRDFAWGEMKHTLMGGMNWGMMLFSLLFGILPQIFRGLRWRQTLEPLNEYPSRRHCVNSIFLSFAASLVVPRIGELTRCATLKRTDNVSFTKALGTVVTERVIDSLLVLIVVTITFLWKLPVFLHFLAEAGTSWDESIGRFTTTGYLVTFFCAVAALIGGILLVWHLAVFSRLKGVLLKLWEGVVSLRKVKNLWGYTFFTLAIWSCYFLHFYLAFFAFPFTSHLSAEAGLVAFCMITVAVLVPTPNGAGPWHFAVKTVLVLYGVGASNAIMFALIVHTLQTFLLVLLGVYALIFLPATARSVRRFNLVSESNSDGNESSEF